MRKVFDKISENIPTSKESTYILQIDLMKGLCIIAVILLHTFPSNILISTFSQFHIWQAVPIFFILMGITTNISFNNKTSLYSKKYFINKFKRIMVPYIAIFLISLIWGIIHKDYYIGWLWLIGFLPVTGPGNYFVSIMLQHIIIIPMIYHLFLKFPKSIIIILFSLDIFFQLIAPYITILETYPYLYSACILRYFSAIALGLYISKSSIKLIDIEYKSVNWLSIGFIISALYLFMARFETQPFPLFLDSWGSQNIISFFYPLFLVIFMYKFFPKKAESYFLKLLAMIGKASYHIFLVQIIFFGFGFSLVKFVSYDNLLISAPIVVFLNVALNLFLGFCFYSSNINIESKVGVYIKDLKYF